MLMLSTLVNLFSKPEDILIDYSTVRSNVNPHMAELALIVISHFSHCIMEYVIIKVLLE